ncbi:hypothetical protein BKA70DRAFT_97006 [Coprinopsis sp. MPI-PUGE-AT-0042]|nr:hypothetical protein BKA70DRAFT_97006 [Coprinopsis sp. MPI-PUGE-AT-0042]
MWSTRCLCSLAHPLVLHRTRLTFMFLRTKTAFALALPLIKLAVALDLDLGAPVPFHSPSRSNWKPSSHQRPRGGIMGLGGKAQENVSEQPVGAYKLDEDTTNRVLGWIHQDPSRTWMRSRRFSFAPART